MAIDLDSVSSALRQPDVPLMNVGSNKFRFVDQPHCPNHAIDVWYHRPVQFTPQSPILIVLHGNERDARCTRNVWTEHAEERAALLLAPEFDGLSYPGSLMYHLGGVFERDGLPRSRTKWTFSVIERLFDVVRAATCSERTGYLLYGHSAGAQFIHRLLYFLPNARVDRAVIANAGWYTLPRPRERFPYGLGSSGIGNDELRKALARDLTILLGQLDTATDDADLRKTPHAMRQGTNRFERGINFLNVAIAQAAALETELAWSLATVPSVGHSTRVMARHATHHLFR